MYESDEYLDIEPSIFSTESISIWEEYEEKKRQIQHMGVSHREYERRVMELAKQLGI